MLIYKLKKLKEPQGEYKIKEIQPTHILIKLSKDKNLESKKREAIHHVQEILTNNINSWFFIRADGVRGRDVVVKVLKEKYCPSRALYPA